MKTDPYDHPDSLARRFYRAINHLQRSNRFIEVSANDISLSRLETFILIELQADPARGIAELTHLLGGDSTTISRSLGGLVKKGLLRSERTSGERRLRFILTALGIKAIRAIDERTDQIIEKLSRGLTPRDFKRVIRLFERISTALGEKPAIRRAHESDYRAEQRRVTRAMGLLKEQAFTSGLSHLCFHLLLILEEAGELTAAEASSLLNAQAAATSLAVKQLESRRLIFRETSGSDRRSLLLRNSPAGITLLKKVESSVADSLLEIFREADSKQMADSIRALEKFLKIDSSSHSRLSVRKLASDMQRKAARVFAITVLVESGRQGECPEHLFSSTFACYGLFKRIANREELVAAAQWRQVAASLEREFCISGPSVSKEERKLFLTQAKSLSTASRTPL